MKTIATRSVLTFIVLLASVAVSFAQLKVSVNITSRPDPYLSNWSQRKETVIATIVNTGSQSVDVKFDCKINKNGSSQANTKPESMRIQSIPPGVSQFYGEDLVPFESVKISGDADKTAIKTGMLPAGMYEFCVALLDPVNKQITPPVCKSFSIQSYQAPVLLLPEDKAGIKKDARPMFRWSAVSPKPNFPFQYRLQVFEVMQGQTPMTAFRANRPILDRNDITVTQFQWPADVELPNPKLQHIWTIRAVDDKGNGVGEPDGYATPFTFADCCFYPIGCCPPDQKLVDENPKIKDSIDKKDGKDVNNTTKNSDNIDPRDSMSGSRDKTNKDPNKDSLHIKQGNLGNSYPNSGNPTNYASCPWNLYPNPNCGGGVQCYPCLGCCMCPGTSIYDQQFCDILTGGTLNIMNIHPNAFLNDYVYFDGKIVKSQNVDFSLGGTLLLQVVDSLKDFLYVPGYLVGKEVALSHNGLVVSKGIVDSNGMVQLQIPVGTKSLNEFELTSLNPKFPVYKTTNLCELLQNEVELRQLNEDSDNERSDRILGDLTNLELDFLGHSNRCWKSKLFVSNKFNIDRSTLQDFPITTLPKFDKDQIRLTQSENFTWSNPEIIGAMGYKSLTFSKGDYKIKKDTKTGNGFIELAVLKGIKIDDKSNLPQSKMVLECHIANYECKGVGFDCMVLFPDSDNGTIKNNFKVIPIIENNQIVKVRLELKHREQHPSSNSLIGKYFQYESDYTVVDEAIVNKLGVKQLIIKRGKYPLEFKDNPNGEVIFDLSNPINQQQFLTRGNHETTTSAIFMRKDCKEEGTICFYHPGGNNPKINLAEYKLIPIFEGETATKLKLTIVNWIIPPTEPTTSTSKMICDICGWYIRNGKSGKWCASGLKGSCKDNLEFMGNNLTGGWACQDYTVNKTIKVELYDNGNGTASVSFDGKEENIVSDMFISWYKAFGRRNQIQQLQKLQFDSEIDSILKIDNGVVSHERLIELGQILGVEIIKRDKNINAIGEKQTKLRKVINRQPTESEKIALLPLEKSVAFSETVYGSVGLAYSVMEDEKGNLYGVPIPLIGGIIPSDSAKIEGLSVQVNVDIKNDNNLHYESLFTRANLVEGALLEFEGTKAQITTKTSTSEGYIYVRQEGSIQSEPLGKVRGNTCVCWSKYGLLIFTNPSNYSCADICAKLLEIRTRMDEQSRIIQPNGSNDSDPRLPTTKPQYAVNPIPGVGVIVKKNPCKGCTSVLIANNDIEKQATLAGALTTGAKVLKVEPTADHQSLTVSYQVDRGNPSLAQLEILDVSDGTESSGGIQGKSAQAAPVKGIGVVVKKNPGGKAFLVPGTLTNDGAESTPSQPQNSTQATPVRGKTIKTGKNPGGSIVISKADIKLLCDAVIGSNVEIKSYSIIANQSATKVLSVSLHNTSTGYDEGIGFPLEDNDGFSYIVNGSESFRCWGCKTCSVVTNQAPPFNDYCSSCIIDADGNTTRCNKTKTSLISVEIDRAFDLISKNQARGVQPNGNNDSDPRLPKKPNAASSKNHFTVKLTNEPPTLPTPPPLSVPTYGAGSVRPLLCKCCGMSLTETAHDEATCCKEKGDTPKNHYSNPDGTLKYFEYTSDYVITDKKVCEALGVKEVVIAPGIYRVEYRDPKAGGTVILKLKTAIPSGKIRSRTPVTIEGTNPKGMDCKSPGNSCFFVTDSVGARIKPTDSCIFTVAPYGDTTCLQIQVSFRGVGSPKSAGF